MCDVSNSLPITHHPLLKKEVIIRPPFFRGPVRKERGPRINQFIRVPQIRLIGSDGNQLGLFATEAALKMAREEGLDLVEISPQAKPPVCKIMDYGKYKYNQQKKMHASRKHQTVIHVKEVKMGPNIDTHDLEFKKRHIRRFLEGKDKAKVIVQFRGREVQYKERGLEILNKIIKEMEDIGQIEFPPKMEGRFLSTVLAPK